MTKHHSILIVDDTATNLQVLTQMLSDQGYKIRIAPGGKLALNSIKIDPPDLILLDIKMSDIDGYEVCKILKENPETADIPVIFMTALDEILDKVKAFEVGGVDYLTKPVHVMEVITRVKNQLKFRCLQLKLIENNQNLQQEIKNRETIEINLKQTSEKLFQRTDQLEKLNQELEAFSYRVSHDLRNSLANINALTILLQEQYASQLEPSAQEYIKLIDDSRLNMMETLDGLMTLSQINNREIIIESVNLTVIINQIFEQFLINNSLRKIQFIVESNLIVKGDQRLLKIAFENLINNGVKYSKKDQEIIIKVGVISIDQTTIPFPQCFISELEKTKIKQKLLPIYFIQDNGIGFDLKEGKNIFTPFERLHDPEEFKGTGIGLSTVQKIIHRHGGLIWCDSQPNQGSTFYFTINPEAIINYN